MSLIEKCDKMKHSDGKESADRIISLLTRTKGFMPKIPNRDILNVLRAATPIFLNEPSVLNLRAPINVCGDVHGQFPDFITIFEKAEFPPNAKYLFLGDYVDRGPQSLEVICLLFAMKVRFPNHIFLIRGNHETREMTEEYGFAVECQSKQNKFTYQEFIAVFDSLPLAATINDKFFCIHGGLTPGLERVEQINLISRPTQIQERGFLADLVWSDPSKDVEEFAPSERGLTIVWGKKIAHKFLETNGFTKIIRAHQMVEEGYDYPFAPDECVITVFSAPWYAGEFKNKGAFLKIDKNLGITPVHILHNDKAEPMKFAAPPAVRKNDKKGKKFKDKGKKGKR
jgi:serine/threonine-protein phosphatase PP1 catalytic subunit